jgi:hypothetical protein
MKKRFDLALAILLMVLFSNIIPVTAAAAENKGPSTVTSLTVPPIQFSETSDGITLDFTMFRVFFAKGTAGYNVIYDKFGGVLVYDDRITLDYLFKAPDTWKQRGTPRSISWIKISDYHYEVTRFYDDFAGTTYNVKYTVKSDSPLKITITLNSGRTDTYRITWSPSGIVKTDWKKVGNRFVFGDESVDYSWVSFDWEDVYQGFGDITTTSVESVAQGRKANIFFNVGTVNAGQTLVVDPSTVGTSTTYFAVSWSSQRKGFYAAGRFWAFYYDGANYRFVFESTTDPSDWSGTATSVGSGSSSVDFSVWFDGTYVHYARSWDWDLFYRRGTPINDGTITWSAVEQKAHDGSTTRYLEPCISVGSDGYAWIGARYFDGTKHTPYVLKNANNDGTWSTGFAYQLNTISTQFWFVQPVALTAGKVYVVYCTEAELPRGRLYTGSWGGEESDLADYAIQQGYRFSAVNEGDNVHFTYNRYSTYQIRYNKRTYGTGWGATDVLVQASMEFDSSPALSIDAASGNLYCFWTRIDTDHVYYKKCVGGTWDTDPTDWIDESTDDIRFGHLLSSYYQAYNNYIGLLYVTKLASPYDVRFAYLDITAANIAPSITDFQAPATVYAGKYFLLNATINDANGIADFVNATVALSNSVTLRWVADGDTWSKEDPSNYCTLDSAGSVRTTLNSTAYKLSFRIKLGWSYPGGSFNIESSGTKVYDTQGASGTGGQVGIATFKNVLSASVLTVNDYRCNPSQALTFSGYWYYEGTSIPPPDGDYQVKIKLSGVQKGSTDTTLVSGAFSISDVTAESTVSSYSYTVEATYMASAGSFTAVIVDRIKVSSYTVSDSRANINDNVNIDATLVYEYDSTAVTTGTITSNGYSATHQGSGVYRITQTSSAVTSVTYNTVAGSESTYDLNTVNQNSQSTTVIWDRITVSFSVNTTTPDMGDTVLFTVSLTRAFDSSSVTDYSYTINRDGSAFGNPHTSATFTDMHNEEVSYTYDFTSVIDNTYGITVFVDPNNILVAWASPLKVYQGGVVDGRIDINSQGCVWFKIKWTNETEYTSIHGTATLNGSLSLTYVSARTRWEYNPTISSTGERTYHVASISGGTFGDDVGDKTIIWDGLKVDSYSVDMASAKVYAHLKYAYDNLNVNGGTIGLAGRTATTNSTGWAMFDMATGADFSWSQTAYGIQDGTYGITYKAENQALPIAKKTRFIQSDAEISSLAWDGVKFTVQFTATGTYTLKVSGTRPVYVKGVDHDLSTDYTTHLTISHLGERDIVVGWPSWGDFYIRSLNQGWMTNIYWTDQKLTLVLNGTSGMSGTLTIYCGSRGMPKSTSGFSATPEYNSLTKILAGQYSFASEVTLTLDFTMPVGGGGGGGVPAITFSVATVKLEAQAGRTVEADLSFTWVGVTQIDLVDVRFGGAAAKWVTLAETLPKRVSKGIGDWEGRGAITIRLMVPGDAQLGEYTLPVTVDAEAVGGRITAGGWVTFNVVQPSPAYSPVPDYMTYLFAALLLSIVAAAYLKSR